MAREAFRADLIMAKKWLNKVKWDDNGLVPVIVQEVGSNDVLMFAFMNRDALQRTVELGEAVFWSRSRKRLWHKGEESGHVQKVHEIRLDCDEDVVLLKVTQIDNIACHTGRIPASSRSSRAMWKPATGRRSSRC